MFLNKVIPKLEVGCLYNSATNTAAWLLVRAYTFLFRTKREGNKRINISIYKFSALFLFGFPFSNYFLYRFLVLLLLEVELNK
ncbi:hypothetical protein Csa_006136 [Cucumis sativus]|uniref:Uncharacterized protein n=1 Tax=Cucumis sativus TaxID=3659 RepID=A0A0A0LHF2_CUCSA|nr:hypothetical protein Csa_006136 [Cucumis sativus]